ncbi:MAG TPA: flagellar biosynthetic protein FliO [Steroidobacteraceae bacterium]|nr:flagellar biosynthetic protein FliO [Steroidobacteraceae bacterium]
MFAAPHAVPAAAATGIGELAHVILALLLVLAVVLLLARLVRRARGGERRGTRPLEVLDQVALGQKERAVLLRVGRSQLLLGVAPGRVSHLYLLAEPCEPTPVESVPAGPSFAALLRRSLGV